MSRMQQQIAGADPAALAYIRGNSTVVAGALDEVKGGEGGEDGQQATAAAAGSPGSAPAS